MRFLKADARVFSYVASASIRFRGHSGRALTPWAHFPTGSRQRYTSMTVAVLGTTIIPYLFFWQASHEVGMPTIGPEGPSREHPVGCRPPTAHQARHLPG